MADIKQITVGSTTYDINDTHAVKFNASQSLTDTQKSQARSNIGAGTSSFSGSYNDLTNKPTIPAAANNGTLTIQRNGTQVATFSANQSGNATANITVPDMMVSTTWSALKALRDGGTLVPGQQYRITDYQCTTTQANTSSAGHQFDIIVTADSANKLNEVARACLHSGDTYFASNKLEAWQLWYCIDNDTTRFDWADATNGKGVIYRMIDEFNNDVPYDFKNILFKRYDVSEFELVESQDFGPFSAKKKAWFNSVKTTLPYRFYAGYSTPMTGQEAVDEGYADLLGVSEDEILKSGLTYCIIDDPERFGDPGLIAQFDADHITYKWFYTFTNISNNVNVDGSLTESCNNNKVIGTGKSVFYNVFIGVNSCFFEGNVLSDNCYSNTFGDNCIYNTLGSDCYSNTFGGYCRFNTFGTLCYYNTFGDDCYYNTVGNEFYYNIFYNDCHSNEFEDHCGSNVLEYNCGSNKFACHCGDNTFGESCQSNTFGKNCSSNTFGHHCQSNTFGYDCNSNTFGYQCSSNTISDNCGNNTLGNNCNSNTLGHNCNHNTFGEECNYNIFGGYCDNSIFGNYCSYNTFGNYCRAVTLGTSSSSINYCRYIVLDNGCGYLYINSSDTSAASDNYLQNIHVHLGASGLSVSYRKTITIPERNLIYETNVYINEYGNIEMVTNSGVIPAINANY